MASIVSKIIWRFDKDASEVKSSPRISCSNGTEISPIFFKCSMTTETSPASARHFSKIRFDFESRIVDV